MKNRVCNKCNISYTMTEYQVRTHTNYRQYVSLTCKSCERAYKREHYQKNKERIHIKEKQKRQDRKLECINKMGGCCAHCGGIFPPAAYDFHHIDPSTKTARAKNILKYSDTELEKELNNCILLCANCHRIEHTPRVTEVTTDVVL